MRSSDRIWAAALAVIVWLFAGYAIASRATAPQAVRSCALGARAVGSAAVGLAIGRPGLSPIEMLVVGVLLQ